MIQKAIIEVEEKGTVAAAATAAIVDTSESAFDDEPPKIDFVANHPFIFYLRDLQTGLLLFQGRVVDPSASGGPSKLDQI